MSPLIGITGMMKNSVMNRIPFLLRKWAAFPQVPQRISSDVNSEPQKNTFVPIISKVADTLAGDVNCSNTHRMNSAARNCADRRARLVAGWRADTRLKLLPSMGSCPLNRPLDS